MTILRYLPNYPAALNLILPRAPGIRTGPYCKKRNQKKSCSLWCRAKALCPWSFYGLPNGGKITNDEKHFYVFLVHSRKALEMIVAGDIHDVGGVML